MFRRLDLDSDGAVTCAEFRHVLPLLNFDGSQSHLLDALFRALDTNGNGAIEVEELERALRRDDIVLREELQAGAVSFELESRNAIELRRVPVPV